jgi:hypothetical protein
VVGPRYYWVVEHGTHLRFNEALRKLGRPSNLAQGNQTPKTGFQARAIDWSAQDLS